MLKQKSVFSIFCLILINGIIAKKPTVYICTGIYCDAKGEESVYNIRAKSSSPLFQNIYWMCASTMFASSIKNNPNACHMLFSNKSKAPEPFNQALHNLNVTIKTLPFTYRPPKGFYPSFNNTFFLLNIIEHLSSMTNEEDIVIITDADCFWLKNAESLIKQTQDYQAVSYFIDYKADHNINGLTRKECQDIYSDILHKQIDTLPQHLGGELIAATGKCLKKIAASIKPAWELNLHRYHTKKPYFKTEEHLLSFIYHTLGLNQKTDQIKRIYTRAFSNIDGNETGLTLWHLPEEKVFNFVSLFKQTVHKNSPFWQLPQGKQYIEFCNSYLKILSKP